MNEREYYENLYKKYLREPYFHTAIFQCSKNKKLFLDVGICIQGSFGGGLVIKYERLDGSKITSLVHSEKQYIEELYKISEIAYAEHPECSKPIIVNESIEDRAERISRIEKELGCGK